MLSVRTHHLGIFIFSVISCLHAKLSPQFKECREYFVNKKLPSGFPDEGKVDICQTYLGLTYYATRYSLVHKIPNYSAYLLDITNKDKHAFRKKWMVDLALAKKGEDMGEQGKNWDAKTKAVQAMNEDYDNPKFDKGHMNPDVYHEDDAAKATFTLTNAVPQYVLFNRIVWAGMEKVAKDLMLNDCLTQVDTGTPHFITGAIPSEKKLKKKVTIPGWLFTAACCKKDKDEDSFSFGFLAENVDVDVKQGGKPDMIPVEILDVVKLGKRVNELWTVPPAPKKDIIFFDGSCNYKNKDAVKDLKKRAKNHSPKLTVVS